jgi:hypothetical protein
LVATGCLPKPEPADSFAPSEFSDTKNLGEYDYRPHPGAQEQFMDEDPDDDSGVYAEAKHYIERTVFDGNGDGLERSKMFVTLVDGYLPDASHNYKTIALHRLPNVDAVQPVRPAGINIGSALKKAMGRGDVARPGQWGSWQAEFPNFYCRLSRYNSYAVVSILVYDTGRRPADQSHTVASMNVRKSMHKYYNEGSNGIMPICWHRIGHLATPNGGTYTIRLPEPLVSLK